MYISLYATKSRTCVCVETALRYTERRRRNKKRLRDASGVNNEELQGTFEETARKLRKKDARCRRSIDPIDRHRRLFFLHPKFCIALIYIQGTAHANVEIFEISIDRHCTDTSNRGTICVSDWIFLQTMYKQLVTCINNNKKSRIHEFFKTLFVLRFFAYEYKARFDDFFLHNVCIMYVCVRAYRHWKILCASATSARTRAELCNFTYKIIFSLFLSLLLIFQCLVETPRHYFLFLISFG